MTDNRIGNCPGSPPWLWVWIVIYLMQLPVLATWPFRLELPEFQQSSSEVTTANTDAFMAHAEEVSAAFRVGLRWSFNLVTRSIVLCVFVAIFTPLLGITAFLMPRRRCRMLEQKYSLQGAAHYGAISSLAEIQQFVDSHCSRVEVYVNPTRTAQAPFCYSSGFRSSRIAIFGSTIMLWCSNRPAAESVLLHELSHARHGDAVLLGPAGLLQRILRLMAWASGLTLCIPNLVTVAVLLYLVFWSWYHNEWLVSLLSEVALMFTLLVGTCIASMFWIALLLLLPVFWVSLIAAVWSTEVSADYHALQESSNREGLLNALNRDAGKRTLWYRYLSLFAHPPRWLRLRLAKNPGAALVFMLTLFPLSFFFTQFVNGLVSFVGDLVFQEASFAFSEAGADLLSRFTSRAGRLLICGLFCLLWPRMSADWKQFWNPQHTLTSSSLLHSAVHLKVGAAWCGLGVLGIVIDPTSAARGLVEFGM